MSAEALTQDTLLGGGVRLAQPARGYRAGMDALLLAAAVPEGAGEALDFGCGVGAVMLCARRRLGPGWRWTGLEREADMAALARSNVEANAAGAEMAVVQGDAHALPADWQNRFALVVSNPPYFEPGAVSPPGEGRAAAYLAEGGLRAWLNAMLFACAPRGRIVLVHRAAELARILAVIDRQTGEIVVQPLHPREGEPASRVIIHARKGLRPGPLRLLAGRVLHAAGGPSDWLAAVSEGRAGL